jgi:hypothetical protein
MTKFDIDGDVLNKHEHMEIVRPWCKIDTWTLYMTLQVKKKHPFLIWCFPFDVVFSPSFIQLQDITKTMSMPF